MMRAPEWIQMGLTVALALLAWTPRLELRRRWRIALLAGIAVAAVVVARFAFPARVSGVVRDWLPAALLLLPYWQAGQFFRGANPRIEQRLGRADERVFEWMRRHGLRAIGFWWSDFLELAYLMCYPVVPLGLGVLYLWRQREVADFYWVVVLLASDICFVLTIFVPAMPPRALVIESPGVAERGNLRRLNFALLNRGSIQAITFPSAHVASTVACGLVLLLYVPAAGVAVLALAAGVAVGAFLGRYHYFLDVVAGAALALGVFLGCVWFR
jgi:membrane-associated phospholipid phosphatase